MHANLQIILMVLVIVWAARCYLFFQSLGWYEVGGGEESTDEPDASGSPEAPAFGNTTGDVSPDAQSAEACRRYIRGSGRDCAER